MSHITIERAVIEQALEALKHSRTYADVDNAITALRSALESAESVEQEPVAWKHHDDDFINWKESNDFCIPLYTHPAPAEVDLGKNTAVINQIVDQLEELQKYREALEMARTALQRADTIIKADRCEDEREETCCTYALAEIEEVLK